MGINSNTDGMTLEELGVDDAAVKTAFATASPVTVEIEGGATTSSCCCGACR